MTDVSLDFGVDIHAPVHTVFEYCRDPRRIYAGDPTHQVSEVTVVSEGAGTQAQVQSKVAVFIEDIAIEYVEVVPDERIVFEARPKMSIRGLRWFVVLSSLHTWTWTFAPEDGGTRLTAVVVEHDAPRWERALDALTAGTPTRTFSKEIRGRLDRIRAGAEEQAASAA